MHYNLFISQRAEEMLDEIVNYLIQHLKSRQAALHLLILNFKVLNDTVCVLGIFHQLEQYNKKL